jgi:membrane protease YdiL (CAAX protease family)
MLNAPASALILATVLAVMGPLTSPFERRFLRSDPSTMRKLLWFALNIVLSWGLTAAAVAIYGWSALANSRGWTGWLPFVAITRPVLGLLLAGYFALSLMPFVQSLGGARRRAAYAAAYRRHAAEFPGLLPANALERTAFILVALTAGICEEVLFRGFLIRFLHAGAPGLPLVAALLVSSLVFGLNHLYQGWKGALGTSVAGLGFGLLFLVTGSLIPAIVIHALIDLQVVYVLRPVAGAAIEPAAP